MGTLQQRMLRAAKLDAHLYEEVEADPSATKQAVTVVVLAAVAAGIGNISREGFGGLITGTLISLISWYVWAFLTYFIGTRLLPEPQTNADLGQLLRTIGFASSPGLIRVVGIVPGLQMLVNTIASIWMLVAMVVAVRQALDYQGTGRAILVCLIGWLVQVAFFVALALLRVGAGA